MTMSVLDRLNAAGLVQLAAEIDPDAAAAADATPETEGELQERLTVAEETIADNELAIEIRGDLDDAESIVIEIRKDDEMGEELADAAEEMTETVITTESFMKEGGMTAQTAQEHIRNLDKLCAKIGFAKPAGMPSYESFGGIGSRLDATGLIFQEEQNWLKKLWNTIKGWLKTAYDNVMKFLERCFTLAGRLEARAQGIANNIMKRKQFAKTEKVKVGAGTVKFTGTGNIKDIATKLESAFVAAHDAAEKRAVAFNAAIVSAMNSGSKDKVEAPAIQDVTAPGDWKFTTENGKVSWGTANKGAEAEFDVVSREDIKAAALKIVELAQDIKSVKGSGGKNAQGYKDSVAAGEKYSNKVEAAGGAATAEAKKAMTERLNSLKEARQAFTQPGVAVIQWSTTAGNAVLDVLAKMSKAYSDTRDESTARAEKGTKKDGEAAKEGEADAEKK